MVAAGGEGSGVARTRLSRDRIVASAVTVADAEGLDAVSIRRVAAELGARTMTLYSHLGGKVELLDRMFDGLAEELLALGPLPDNWREALVELAGRKRRSCLAHPWSIELYAQQPRLGEWMLRLLEESLVSIRGLTADPVRAWQVVNAVDDYTLGFVMRELAGREAPRRYGMSTQEWEVSLRETHARIGAADDLTALAAVLDGLRSAPAGSTPGDEDFDRGLSWLIDGLADTA